MAKTYKAITSELQRFIEKQHVFFVATAPLDGSGHVNLSPKGQDTFRVLGPRSVGYLDLTGSGNETSAHLLEDGNGRLTIMFCAFSGSPRILRLYGKGKVVLPEASEWVNLRDRFSSLRVSKAFPGVRQIVVAEIERVQTSCGMAVPLMEYVEERNNLNQWAQAKGEEGLAVYRQEKNLHNMDGLVTHLGNDSQS